MALTDKSTKVYCAIMIGAHPFAADKIRGEERQALPQDDTVSRTSLDC